MIAALDDFSTAPWAAWCSRAWPLPLALAAAYLLGVSRGGRGSLAGGAPLSCQGALLAWNVLLTVFSAAGAAALLPALVADVRMLGVAELLCPASGEAGVHFARGTRGAVMLAFMLSKVPELADTAFLIARGRPITLLHSWHHASVMVYCWLAYGARSNSGIFFAAMNFCVHMLMYAYFALQAAGARPRWGAAVTRLQIAQMVAGCALVAASAWLQLARGRTCEDPRILAAAALIYLSYLVLFVRFFAAKKLATAAAPGDATAKDE
jgi:hypothetical protein